MDTHPAQPQIDATQPTDGDVPSFGPARYWWRAVLVAAIITVPLNWLLGSLLWLPYYSGLFGFLVEGLIAGAVAFRVARAARPVTKWNRMVGIALLVVFSINVLLLFEYHHFRNKIALPPKFVTTRNRIIRQEKDEAARVAAVRAVETQAQQAFANMLANNFPPANAYGYARWATVAGVADIEVQGERERIEARHRGWIWPVRTGIGALLLALGFWLAFDALAQREPVRNVLLPGEPFDEIDDLDDEEDEAEEA